MSKNNKNNGKDNNAVDDSEPKENDKLADEVNEEVSATKRNNVNNDIKKSRFEMLETRFRRAKTDLTSNRYHPIILVLSVVIIVLLLLIIILSVKLGNVDVRYDANRCETSDCLKAAANVVARQDRTVDACHQFWQYSCNGWTSSNPIPDDAGSWSVRDTVRQNILHKLRHYIDLIPHNVDEGDHRFKVKVFYHSCLNHDDIEYTALSTLKYDIQEIGGWSLLSSWSYQSWDKSKVIERLHTKYGVTPYFKVSVGVDDLDPNQPYIVKIEPDGLGLPAKNYYYDPKYEKNVIAYKNFMLELAKIFGASLLQAKQFAENMFNYEKRIAEVTPELEEYENPSKYLKRRYSIRELMTIAPSVKWLSLLQNLFPKSSITDSTRVLLAFEDYFRNISHIISTTDNTAINDYLMWRFTSTYAPYLTEAFRVINAEFSRAMNGVDSNKIDYTEKRWEFCINAASKFLGNALGSMYIRNNLAKSAERANNLQTLVTAVKNSILENVDSFVWARNEDSRRLIQQKMNQLQLLISQPNFVVKDEINKYYNEFIVQRNFYQNILHGINFLNRKNEILLKSRNSVSDYSWKLLPYDVDIQYEYAGNRLTIPAGMLEEPLYDSNSPLSMQFGSLGFQISAELLRALDLKGLQYGLPDFRISPEQNKSWFTNDTKLSLENKLQCLTADLQQYSDSNQMINPNLTLSQTYTDIGALMFAYNAYQRTRDKLGESGHLPGTDHNNDQLFFSSFAQAMCESVRPQRALILSNHEPRLPSEARVMTVLRQSPIFANAFGCKSSSAMQSEQLCYLWP